MNAKTSHKLKVIEKGWLRDAMRAESPNQSARPDGIDINLLVIHCISLPPGKFGTGCVQQFFQNTLDTARDPYFDRIKDLKVSAHLFIERDGRVIQCVPFHRRAWHAGRSVFDGVDECNDYSIGIELEGTDNSAYTEVQYQRLADVVSVLMHVYPAITQDRITGHSDIAPGRKTDPGDHFDWQAFRSRLKRIL